MMFQGRPMMGNLARAAVLRGQPMSQSPAMAAPAPVAPIGGMGQAMGQNPWQQPSAQAPAPMPMRQPMGGMGGQNLWRGPQGY